MKTVEETKRCIVTCMELNMEHFMPGATQKALKDALACIEQLEADNAQLNRCIENMTDKLNAMIDESVKWKAERDAAVKDCGCFPCQTCEERENGDLCPMCEIMGGYRTFHQWRGAQLPKEGLT